MTAPQACPARCNRPRSPGERHPRGILWVVNRIAIVGPVESGKTTLAVRLGTRLSVPVLDLDDYYWRRSRLATDEEWITKHSELVSGERWVISGDYRAVAPARFRAADAVVWLDLPRPTCLYRATLRKLEGHPAPLTDSWRWIWRYANHGRHDTATALASSDLSCSIYRLRSSDDVTSFLSQIENLKGLWRVTVPGSWATRRPTTPQ